MAPDMAADRAGAGPAAPSAAHALSCADLGKAYAIYARPQDRLKEWLHPGGGHRGELFWALRDISLMIRPGQTVGIVGRNGSGKSTFLQLATGVLRPSEGVLHTQGRVAALLELGTGFNPEFTGRENIRLGAALQGLDPDTIEARIPDIARFADIGHFFDHPVKLYSSGMYARLAFALVAHVDADILIVDEALAVGDAAFSQKCMRFMRSFRERGTLCFVSHDTAAVINLCDSAVWLDHGKLLAFDDSRTVCREYQELINAERRGGYTAAAARSSPDTAAPSPFAGQAQALAEAGEFDPQGPWHGFLGATIAAADLSLAADPACRAFRSGDRLRLRVTARCEHDMASPVIGFSWKDARGQEVFGSNTLAAMSDDETLLAGDSFVAEFHFILPALSSGLYYITLAIAEGDQFNHVHHHWIDEAFAIRVSAAPRVIGIMDVPCGKSNRICAR